MAVTVSSLDHLVLTVADIDRSCDFYGRVLGCRRETFGEGRTALVFGRQKINLHPIENDIALRAAVPTPGSADLCFLTDTPAEEVKRHLEQCGVEILAGPVIRNGAAGPIRSVYFRDPDGNLLEVSNLA
jgi:catechol 2,3-dioxygenase-like lactoylglutathione lyase family enzyme